MSLHAHIAEQAQRVDRHPTEPQKHAGNYQKGHVHLHGLEVSIENPRGSFRSGKDKNGKPWRSRLPHHYGYIRKTEGADGDHVDVFVGPHPKSPLVYVIDQHDARTGKWDEHKAFVGFSSPKQVKRGYFEAFADGKAKDRLGALHEMTMAQFKAWLKDGDTTKPLKNHIERADGGRVERAEGGPADWGAKPADEGPASWGAQPVEKSDQGSEKGMTEAAARGALQGATFNFSDEMAGLRGASGLSDEVKAAVPFSGEVVGGVRKLLGSDGADKGYNEALERERAANKAAQEQHPIVYGVGEVAGALPAMAVLPEAAPFKTASTVGKVADTAFRGAQIGAEYGAVSGAGQGTDAESRILGAAEGTVAGGVTGAALPTVVGAAKGVIGKVGAKAATKQPETEAFFDSAENHYANMRGFGVEIAPAAMNRVADNITTELMAEGYRPRNVPKVFDAIEELRKPAGQNHEISDIDSVRKVLGKARMDFSERDAARRAIGHIDDYVANLHNNPQDVVVNPQFAGRVAEEAQAARGDYAVGKRSEDIDEALDQAERQAGRSGAGHNINNSIRQRLSALRNNKKKMSGWTDDEKAELDAVINGGAIANIARQAGKFAPHGVVSTVMSAGAGHMVAPGIGEVAVPAAGLVSRMIGDRLTARAASRLQDVVKSRSPLGKQTSINAAAQSALTPLASPSRITPGVMAALPGRAFVPNLNLHALQGPVPAGAEDQQQRARGGRANYDEGGEVEFGGGAPEGIEGGAAAGFEGEVGSGGGTQGAGPSEMDFGSPSSGSGALAGGFNFGDLIAGALGIGTAQAADAPGGITGGSGLNMGDIIGGGPGPSGTNAGFDLNNSGAISNINDAAGLAFANSGVTGVNNGTGGVQGWGGTGASLFGDLQAAATAPTDLGSTVGFGGLTGVDPAAGFGIASFGADPSLSDFAAAVAASLDNQSSQGSTAGVPGSVPEGTNVQYAGQPNVDLASSSSLAAQSGAFNTNLGNQNGFSAPGATSGPALTGTMGFGGVTMAELANAINNSNGVGYASGANPYAGTDIAMASSPTENAALAAHNANLAAINADIASQPAYSGFTGPNSVFNGFTTDTPGVSVASNAAPSDAELDAFSDRASPTAVASGIPSIDTSQPDPAVAVSGSPTGGTGGHGAQGADDETPAVDAQPSGNRNVSIATALANDPEHAAPSNLEEFLGPNFGSGVAAGNAVGDGVNGEGGAGGSVDPGTISALSQATGLSPSDVSMTLAGWGTLEYVKMLVNAARQFQANGQATPEQAVNLMLALQAQYAPSKKSWRGGSVGFAGGGAVRGPFGFADGGAPDDDPDIQGPSIEASPFGGAPHEATPIERVLKTVGKGAYDYVSTPGSIMQPNPYPEGSEEADYYDAMRRNTMTDWAGQTALNTMGTGAITGVPVRAGEAVLGAGPIRAYHGSPHDFDKFSLDKIGTGEGAQAYGHGLYFAENPGTAQSYRDSLSDLKPRGIEGQPDLTLPSWVAKTIESRNPVAINDMRINFQGRLAEMKRQLADPEVRQPWLIEANIPGIENILKAIDHVERGAAIKPAGRMYEVDINADPEHFLDWDKPLSEQHPQTQEAVKKAMGIDYHGNFDQAKSDRLWNEFKGANAGTAVRQGFIASDDALVAKRAADAGIPGIKYLDQGSRALDDYMIKAHADGFQVTNLMKGQQSPMFKTLDEAKQWKDKQATRNYVVFDHALVDIVKKYGLAGVATLPPAVQAYFHQRLGTQADGT